MADEEEEEEVTESVTELIVAEVENVLSPEEAFTEEQNLIEDLRGRRSGDGQSDLRFSVAFSGGGIRAAAFQAGVLWRLAKEDKLKDVEYLAAVSGGSYIASAFASHVLAAGECPEGGARQWYLDVVSRTLRRMQTNAGDFVRDCFSNPWYSEEYSGSLPRFLDLPVLLCVLFFTLLVHPVVFTVCFLVPLVIFVQAYLGAGMRAVFCAPPNYDWFEIFLKFSHTERWLVALVGVVVAVAIVGMLRAKLPACQLRKVVGEKRGHATFCYLFGHSLYSLLKRVAWFIIVFLLFVMAVPLEQSFTYEAPEAQQLCATYIAEQRAQNRTMCMDVHEKRVWYNAPAFQNVTVDPNYVDPFSEIEAQRASTISAVEGLVVLLGVVLSFSICITPLIGSELFKSTVGLAGPLLLLSVSLMGIQYVVFGPITKNRHGNFGEYDQERVDKGFSMCLAVALVILPFYDDLRSGLHHYYRRCLRMNYFADGQDVHIRDLKDHPYCPFVVLTGTSNDFQPPGDDDKISELSFSCLHFGGEETGYVGTPKYRTLAKCTAISGAGCLDAISLSMSDALALRFWLEVLNLSWGDYVSFRDVCGTPAETRGRCQACISQFAHRLPGFIAWVVAFALLLDTWDRATGPDQDCAASRGRLDIVGLIFGAMLFMSFFSWTRPGQFMAISPLLRQIHQVTRYYFVGKYPPPKLYMTDGGVKDCTAIVQLLARRRERILLVLAAADPNDELGVLRTALGVATQLKLASFYDPRDPRRSLDVTFGQFKEDIEQRTLHLGISYCFAEGQPTGGHLIIVKNRLPPSLVSPLKPKIRHRDIVPQGDEDFSDETESEDSDDDAFAELNNNDLGPFGCCDCCHTKCNAGPKFPHGSFTGYLYLSPAWCSSLMRLGYDISKEAVDLVSSLKPLHSSWERVVGP